MARRSSRPLTGAALAASLLVVPGASAHDSWLTASASRVPEGTAVRLTVVTGEQFPISDHATDPDRVVEWVAVQGETRRELRSRFHDRLALSTSDLPPAAGVHVHAVRLAPRFIELAPDDFESYLASEQAADALETWREAGRPVGRELYTKAAKTFVAVGATNETGFTRPVGHALEIIPLANPCRLRAGGSLRVRVLLHGAPAAGLRVSAGLEGLEPHTYVAHETTDAEGIVQLDLDAPGHWYLRTHVIHSLLEASLEDRPPAEWESLWASITFRVAAEPEATAVLDPVRAIHGTTDPFAVAGFRMGTRALRAMELPRGAWQLEVTCHGPLSGRPPAILDGLQAATGASAGRGTLRAVEAPLEQIRVECRNRVTGASCTIHLGGAFIERAAAVAAEHRAAAGYRTALMPVAGLMTVELHPAAAEGGPEVDAEGALRTGEPAGGPE